MSPSRRALIAATLGPALTSLVPGEPSAAAPTADRGSRPAPGPAVGHAAGERRAYVDGPLGQTHVRLNGEGPAILLIHQTPENSAQFTKVQPILASAGYATIAPDTPGYGSSPAPAGELTLEDYADNMEAVLERLGHRHAVVAGDHTGAGIAMLMAARQPKRISAIILFGCPLYTEEERQQRLKALPGPDTIKADGSHLSARFVFTRNIMMNGVGSLEAVEESTLSYLSASDKRQMPLRALFAHPPLDAALAAVRAPGLLLSSADDTLHARTQRARAVRPDFRYVEMDGGGSHLIYDRPEAWSLPVLGFLADAGIRPR